MSDRASLFVRVSMTAVVVGLVMSAAAAKAETLQDVIAYAYDNNPGVQAQRAAMRALDETYVQARAGFGPNISVSAGATDYSDRRRRGGTSHADTESSALSVVQPVYTGGRVTSRVHATEAQIKAGRETLRRFELDLLQRVVTAYVGVRRDQQILKISQDTVAVLTKELSDTQARFKVHEVTRTDLAQAQARLSQSKTQLLNAQAQLGISRAGFLAVVGQNPGDLAPQPDILTLPSTPVEAFDAAEANNPQLKSARYTEESSRASVAEAKAARLPSVTARFDMQRAPFIPYDPRRIYDNIRSTSITISQPLFTSGLYSSQIRQAVETNNRDRLTIDDTRLQVLQQVSSAWEQLVALRQELTTAQDEMQADQIAFAGVREEQKAALRTTLDVLNAELELSNAQQTVTRVRASEYIGRVQLLRCCHQRRRPTIRPRISGRSATRASRLSKSRSGRSRGWPRPGLDPGRRPASLRRRPRALRRCLRCLRMRTPLSNPSTRQSSKGNANTEARPAAVWLWGSAVRPRSPRPCVRVRDGWSCCRDFR
jgi:TolC family type I secretion outer membrane protein